MKDPDRRIGFEAVVLQMLWLILRNQCIEKPDWGRASRARGNALTYLDYNGNQSEKAPEYRREETMPDLPWGSR